MSDPQSVEKIRMAIGFLDSSEIIKKRRLETFVALLALTKDTIQDSPRIEVDIQRLAAEMQISTNNYDDIRERLRDLMRTIIDWNRHGIDRNVGWMDSQILGPTQFDSGKIKTQFQDPVWEKLKDPIIYAYITKSSAYRLKSKHCKALNLYFTRTLKNTNTVIAESTIEGILHDILCLDEKSSATYRTYRRLNDKILSKHIPTLNKESLYTVTYNGIREGRKVTKVQWVIQRKSPSKNPSPNEAPELIAPTVSEAVKNKLLEIGFLWHGKATEKYHQLTEVFEDSVLNEYLLFLANKAKEQSLKNHKKGLPDEENKPGGFFFSMLKSDAQVPLFQKERAKQEKAKELAKQEAEQSKKALEEQFEKTLEALHQAHNRERFIIYLGPIIEEKMSEIKSLAQKDPILQHALRLAQGNFDALFERKSSVLALSKYAEKLGFIEKPFDKEVWLHSPEFETYREEARAKLVE